MLILLVTDFFMETTRVANKFNNDAVCMAMQQMQELADYYKENHIVRDAHYKKDVADTFFHATDFSIHCKADCGDNIKWEIIKI